MQFCKTLAHFAALALFAFGAFGQVSFSDPSLPFDELIAEARIQLGDELFDRVSNHFTRKFSADELSKVHRRGDLELVLNSAVWRFSYEDAIAYSDPDAETLTVPEIVAARRNGVVRVECFDAEGGTIGTGTGFVFASRMVVTNRHVMKGAASASVFDLDGREYAVEGVWTLDKKWSADRDWRAPVLDLVMLRVPPARGVLDSLPLASRSPRIGESVIALGHPLGLGQSVTEGIVSARVNTPTLGNALQHTAAISPGSSGSPLLNNRGEVVGIATSFIKDGQSLNFAISVDEFRALTLYPLGTLSQLAKSMALEEHGLARDAYYLALETPDEQARSAALATALEKAQSACSLDPIVPRYWAKAGDIYGELKQYDRSAEALLHAIRLQPGPATIASFRAARERQSSEEQEHELEYFIRAMNQRSRQSPESGSGALRDINDPDAAKLMDEWNYLQSVKTVARRYEALARVQHSEDLELGESHPEQYLSNINQAIRFARDAMELVHDENAFVVEPVLVGYLGTKGWWQLQLERYGESFASAKEAAAIERTGLVVALMSHALWGLGDRDESIKLMREVVELSSGSEFELSSLKEFGAMLALAGRNSEAREVVRQMRLLPDGEAAADELSKKIR